MPCNDGRIFQFPDGHGPSVYTLKVSGPAGAFTAHAEFTDLDDPPTVLWPAGDIIDPAKKTQPLDADDVFSVLVVVDCVADHATNVKVESSVGGVPYCREIPCAKNTSQRIIHVFKRLV